MDVVNTSSLMITMMTLFIKMVIMKVTLYIPTIFGIDKKVEDVGIGQTDEDYQPADGHDDHQWDDGHEDDQETGNQRPAGGL